MLTHAKCENEGLKHWSCTCHTGYRATVTMEIIKCFHDNQKLAKFQADCTPRKSKPEKRWWITVQFQYVTKASTAMSGPSESRIPRKSKRAGSCTQDTIQQKSPNMTFISAEKFRSSFATLKPLKLCLVLKL